MVKRAYSSGCAVIRETSFRCCALSWMLFEVLGLFVGHHQSLKNVQEAPILKNAFSHFPSLTNLVRVACASHARRKMRVSTRFSGLHNFAVDFLAGAISPAPEVRLTKFQRQSIVLDVFYLPVFNWS